MRKHVVYALFKRNFVSYFSSPTGYVFICVFVLLTALAAFWPNDFFNANLANLDQLNKYLPHIMLVFIPAITMSIWAEERRQATDELILTLPAADGDVVAGKYLAAVAIFSGSLAFSFVSNFMVLSTLGSPDAGLFISTYLGYWVLGLAMLAIGMVASFLTANLTVSFILGAVLNAPLVFASSADVVVASNQVSSAIQNASFSEQFSDFGRGVLSLSSIAYFAAIIGLMLYLSMILIGRRHWHGGRSGQALLRHYLVRSAALLVIVVSVSVFFAFRDWIRIDLTSEKLSSLSPQTRARIAALADKRSVQIDAYISPHVPESYVQTQLNLRNTLDDLSKLNVKVRVAIHSTEKYSDEAERAEQQFGITSRQVPSRTRGAFSVEDIYLGVAFTCGLDRVVLPFVDRGIPLEYELVRSIVTVAQAQRKRVGILSTDAQLYGRFNAQAMSMSRNEPVIEELQKQYEVVQVNAAAPITERYDVLLAVQPSSLPQPQLDNFLAAVSNGQPTAIFEDPFPLLDGSVPATSQPRRPNQQMGGMFGGGMQPPEPKGDLTALWDFLAVDLDPQRIIWQKYNPYKKFQQFYDEFVFIDKGSGAQRPFSEKDPITSGLQQVLLLFPGTIEKRPSSELEFTPLLTTGPNTGFIPYRDVVSEGFLGQTTLNPNMAVRQRPAPDDYILAARIRGEREVASPPETLPAVEKPDAEKKPEAKKVKIDVVLVSDIDAIYSAFFGIRERAEDEFHLALDNVTFVLNVLDELAGDDRFIEIRKRRRVHRLLSRVEEATAAAQDNFAKAKEGFVKEFDKAQRQEQEDVEARIEKLRDPKGGDVITRLREIEMAEQVYRNRMNATVAQLQKKRDRELKRVETELALNVRKVQDRYKLMAVGLPPIPPLLLGIAVFFVRRSREREGVAQARLR